MRSKFYVYAYSNENVIRALHKDLQFPGSVIRPLKHAPLLSNQEMPWVWETPCRECSTNFPEGELEEYLHNNADLLKKLEPYSETLAIQGVIVREYVENDQHCGYSISSNLIKMLSGINASLEIDVVPLV